MTQIVMLLSNPYKPDPRVQREAEALVKMGFRVAVIGWDRQAALPAEQELNGVHILRIHNVKSTYGAGVKQLARIPRYWREAERWARSLEPDVVHCHDLDTLYAGWRLKRRLGCKLVFDAHEDYPALMSLYLPAVMVRWLRVWERFLLKRADWVITASTVLADRYRALGYTQIITLGNFQSLAPYDEVQPSDVLQARQSLGLTNDDFALAYIGGFSRNRLLAPLLEAASMLPEVRFFIWGDGHQRGLVEDAACISANLRYMGWLPAEEVPLYARAVNALYYCLQPDYPGAIYNAPNTLSIAMSAGLPIIANRVGDLGRIVDSTGCGILLEQVTPQAICAAIATLQQDAVYARVHQSALAAARSRYNWESEQGHLLELYSSLISH